MSAATSNAVREGLILPFVFLTVSLLGGVRVPASGGLVFVPPPLVSLVLALLLMGVIVRACVLRPDRLMSARRLALENLSGLFVVLSLLAATAQVFNTLTPEAGLLHLVFTLVFGLLLWNTLAVRPFRRELFRSLSVIFGGAFVLKYIVLAALYDPSSGMTRRLLAVLLEGVTLGGLSYQPDAPLSGYIALLALCLYMIGLSLLPRGRVPIEGRIMAGRLATSDGPPERLQP